ncbi:MAG: helix-turn-helix domain-containing protein [Steroidobacteraceae bacterium]
MLDESEKPKQRRGVCSICVHQERARAELLLAAGGKFSETARKFGMSEDSLERHWKRYVPEKHRKALRPGAEALLARMELSAQIAEENTSSLDHLKAVRAILWQMLTESRARGQTLPAAAAAAQYVKTCALIGKLTGELAQSALVTSTHYHVHLTEAPEFQQLMDDVARALAPYSEARRAVFEQFSRLEQQPEERVIDLPALAHQHAHAAQQ